MSCFLNVNSGDLNPEPHILTTEPSPWASPLFFFWRGNIFLVIRLCHDLSICMCQQVDSHITQICIVQTHTYVLNQQLNICVYICTHSGLTVLRKVSDHVSILTISHSSGLLVHVPAAVFWRPQHFKADSAQLIMPAKELIHDHFCKTCLVSSFGFSLCLCIWNTFPADGLSLFSLFSPAFVSVLTVFMVNSCRLKVMVEVVWSDPFCSVVTHSFCYMNPFHGHFVCAKQLIVCFNLLHCLLLCCFQCCSKMASAFL